MEHEGGFQMLLNLQLVSEERVILGGDCALYVLQFWPTPDRIHCNIFVFLWERGQIPGPFLSRGFCLLAWAELSGGIRTPPVSSGMPHSSSNQPKV